MGAYESLLAYEKETIALRQVMELLSWDQETYMPKQGHAARAEHCATLEATIHARNLDPRVEEWLSAVDESSLSSTGKVNVREIRRNVDRAKKVPGKLAAEIARVTASSQKTWAAARRSGDYQDFAPTLARVVELKREEAKCLSPGDPYAALLDEFEPGAKVEEVAEVFGRLRPRLRDLLARITETGVTVPDVGGGYDGDAQMALAHEIARDLHYDYDSGRMDLAVHPFTSGAGKDVRITTRVRPDNPFDCLYSTIHEVGHGLYEQGIAEELEWVPAGMAVSMGVHESQSRFWENQIGRSRAYAKYLHPRMKEHFSNYPLASDEELYRALNRVEASFIRTESDEVTYNLHIILRFELERALIGGELDTKDLEGEWNKRFTADFGIEVEEASKGVLQDIHWGAGLFGYFPTYALGNLFAGDLRAAIVRDIPDLDDKVSKGDFAGPLSWLRERVHSCGKLYGPTELIAKATGTPPSEKALLDYLEAKFGELYGL